MGRIRVALRFLAVLAFAVWMGGFVFYGGVVVPILHDELESLQAGGITRRVTDALNGIGAAAVALWWVVALTDGRAGATRPSRLRLVLLTATSAVLALLMGLHREMDRRLDSGAILGFYPLHRIYLWISTVQWAVNVALLAAMLTAWSRAMGGDRHPNGPDRDS